MSNDLLFRLQKALEDEPENSPQIWKLLREATLELERLQLDVKYATTQHNVLLARLAKLMKRKPPDDDGVPETVPAGPPKRPRGGSPAYATRVDDGGESTSSAQNSVAAVPETDQALGIRRQQTTVN
jgi:hypothetical protein